MKQYAKALKKPNQNHPDKIVFTEQMMQNTKEMLNEIKANGHTYRGQKDKQQQTITIVSGIIGHHNKNGCITKNQYESLYATSDKCLAKGNISKPLPRDDNNLVSTVDQYYNPNGADPLFNEEHNDPNELYNELAESLIKALDKIEMLEETMRAMAHRLIDLEHEVKKGAN
jgi:hypothetical protein